MSKNKLTTIEDIILYIEGCIIQRSRDKKEIFKEIKKMYAYDFDEMTYSIVLDGLTEKYDCCFYGFEFSNTSSTIGFYAKPIQCTP